MTAGPACARCHADSGTDLQYYAFSTYSIVERAMFHEFTRAEAEDMASYIRSLAGRARGPSLRRAVSAGREQSWRRRRRLLRDSRNATRASPKLRSVARRCRRRWPGTGPTNVDTFRTADARRSAYLDALASARAQRRLVYAQRRQSWLRRSRRSPRRRRSRPLKRSCPRH